MIDGREGLHNALVGEVGVEIAAKTTPENRELPGNIEVHLLREPGLGIFRAYFLPSRTFVDRLR
jgi:hypothetical protein